MRLVSAEFLKLRRRYGLVLAALALTVVPMLIGHTLAGGGGPAGGVENFGAAMDLLWGMSLVAAVMIGATLGSGDLGAGVFRELVVTGRSRLALFAARVPAGLALLIPVVAAGFAVTATVSTAFAGSEETRTFGGGIVEVGNVAPGADLLLKSAGWLALVAGASMLIALGVSSVLGSRGTAIGVLLGWFLVAMPLLVELLRPDFLREGLFYAAVENLKPEALSQGATPFVTLSVAASIVVMLLWAAVPLALGAWRTATRDA